jgi:hypothetical protein
MLRFQVAYREIALDWAAERGMRLAIVDDGDNPMGMKRSPILTAENTINEGAVRRLCEYLDEHSDKVSLRFIRQVILSEVSQGRTKQ